MLNPSGAAPRGFFVLIGIGSFAGLLNGCFLFVAGGAGAEGGYIASQKDRSAGQTVSDQWIHAKVKASLISHSKVRAGDIVVTVYKGVVTLQGTVSSAEERQTAIALAKSVNGVRRVVDQLRAASR